MSLALFTKKKKKKKKIKAFKVTDAPSTKPTKKKSNIVEAPAENDGDGWMDGIASAPTYNTLATKIAVVDTRGEMDKPAHENFAKDLEAEKKKSIIHDARRAYASKAEEKKDAPAPKPVTISKWARPMGGSKLNIADTKAFPTLGGGPVIDASNAPAQPVENLWNKTEEENADLIHMALKAEKKEFVSCTQFWGYEFGYFFKNGSEGLGYYKDPNARDIYAPETPVVAEDAGAAAEGESKESEGVSRFANRKKKKKKKKDKDGDAAGEKTKDKKKKKKKKKDKSASEAASPKADATANGDEGAPPAEPTE